MGYVEVNSVSLTLPDGRFLLDEVTFRVGEGRKVALIGANGAIKTTLQDALEIFDGTVAAVTHDRWFAAQSFNRYLIFGSDGHLHETPEPSWAGPAGPAGPAHSAGSAG